jgi:hypothetical protein
VDMTDAERGVYIQVLMGIYSHGGPIDISHAKKLCGRYFSACFARLVSNGKLTVTERQIDNKRAATELQRAANRAANARQNVSKRWKNKELGEEVVLPRGNANHQLSTTNHQLEERTEKKETRRGSRLPADFTVPEEWIKEGKEVRIKAGLPSVNLSAEAEHFVDYWVSRAGRDGAKLDWRATWRNWCRNVRTTHANGNLNGSSEVSERPTPKGPPPKVEGWEIPVHGRTH